MRYFADIGPGRGVVRYCVLGDEAGVFSNPRSAPIGTAECMGRNGLGPSLWRLTVRGTALPGRFIIRDREFLEFKPAPR